MMFHQRARVINTSKQCFNFGSKIHSGSISKELGMVKIQRPGAGTDRARRGGKS